MRKVKVNATDEHGVVLDQITVEIRDEKINQLVLSTSINTSSILLGQVGTLDIGCEAKAEHGPE